MKPRFHNEVQSNSEMPAYSLGRDLLVTKERFPLIVIPSLKKDKYEVNIVNFWPFISYRKEQKAQIV